MFYHNGMRFKLDPHAASWFTRATRPGALAKRASPGFAAKLGAVWDGVEGMLDLQEVVDDREFLYELAQMILRAALNDHYVQGRDQELHTLADLAKWIGATAHTSIIDRLASLHQPPTPREITVERPPPARGRAIQAILGRRGGRTGRGPKPERKR